MKKKFLNFIFTIYIIVAVFATICLLSYNSYKVTEFGNKSLVIISDNELLPELKKGDLVIVDKNELILSGHKAFFYQTYNRNIEISLGNVQKIEKVNSTETTYTFDGDKSVSSEYVLGPLEGSSVIPMAGPVLSILESKWGFLFLIVFPVLLLFINQITKVFADIRESSKEEKENIKNESKK